jgi:hypothetical protein
MTPMVHFTVLTVVAFIDPFLVRTLEDKKACIGLSEK